MVDAGGGSIVMIASLLSFMGGINTVAYAAAKGGVAQLVQSLSNELAPHDVRVNAIAPGYIETELTSTLEDWKRVEVGARIPLGRWGRPDDIAGPVAWLLSEDAPLRHRHRDPSRRRLPRALTGRSCLALPGSRLR